MKAPVKNLRYQDTKVCKECKDYGLDCADGKKCIPAREPLRPFDGVRHTADGFDCALPVTIDSHSSCAYECLYCFSDNIIGHATGEKTSIGQTRLSKIESIFSGQGGKQAAISRHALRYDRRNEAGFPCAVQLGGLCDPCDSIEQNQGWLLKFLELAIKYNQPVRMSTKGALFLLKDYRDVIAKAPHLFWVAFSMITDDDDMMRRVDRKAPDATTRLATMKLLSDMGVRTSLRLRPIMVGITDRNRAYESLIKKAADAGATAISYEVGFYPSAVPKDVRWKWNLLGDITKFDYRKIYSSFGPIQSCTRPSYLWTENIMHHIKELAQNQGMTVGVSDPVWKQLSEVGCCCGIKPDDEVFGNWEPENATNALVIARDTGREVSFADINPPWAKDMLMASMVNMGAGPKIKWDVKHRTWESKLREEWNSIGSQRSVMNYFQGALQPSGIDKNGDRLYTYKGLTREFRKTHWDTFDPDINQ